MKILSNPTTKPLLESYIEKQTINGIDHNVLLFFELKKNKSTILHIPWSMVKNLSYTDDIFNVGLIGEMVIDNDGGILDNIFNNADQFYIGFYIFNTITNFEENIYFSIISSSPIEESRTSSSCSYKLSLMEAFLVEGANRNINAMSMAINASNTNTISKVIKRTTDKLNITTQNTSTKLESENIHSLAEYAVNLIKSDLKINETSQDINQAILIDNSFSDISLIKSETTAHIFDLDTKSLEHFKKSYPTDLAGNVILKDIGAKESVLGLLEKINLNIFSPKVTATNSNNSASEVNLSIGNTGTLRSENLTRVIPNKNIYNGLNNYGERKLTLRAYKDTFNSCFQDNLVYEVLTSPDSKSNITTTYSFISPINVYNITKYPINIGYINNEWCDYLVAPINQPDIFSSSLYNFESIVNTFNQDYLCNKFEVDLLIEKNGIRGISNKIPPFNDSTLNFAVPAKTIRSFFTLNTMVQLTIPGNTFRKCNEIIFIDKSLFTSTNKSDQTSFGNTIESNYFFTTKVTHSFSHNEYINNIFLCSFCKPKSNNK